MKSDKGFALIEFMIVLAIIAIIAVLILKYSPVGLFFSDDNMKKAVVKQGYIVQEITDMDVFFVNWRGCGDGDRAKWEVRATNNQKETVNIVVCSGLFKGYTIRTE